jgi:BirA family biotin operon repressor/biotin-[acetyl-CoA-carboxylase] ligase
MRVRESRPSGFRFRFWTWDLKQHGVYYLKRNRAATSRLTHHVSRPHMNQLDASRIQAQLTTRTFGRNLIVLSQTGSTNDVAKERAVAGAPEGVVVLADEQTAGRGRMGRRWLAPPGTCLLCSILFRPDLPPAQAQRLTMLCALAMADAVEDVAGLRAWLKWPNDLIVKIQGQSPKSKDQSLKPKDQSPRIKAQGPRAKAQGWRKLAGVLTETSMVGLQGPDLKAQGPESESAGWRLEYVVVGIGVNVNVAPQDLAGLALDATSVLAETGRKADRAALLATLLAGVEVRYARLQAGESPHAEWATRLATLGQHVEVITSEGKVVGAAEAVDEDGALLLRTSDCVLHRLTAGDVTLAG